MAAAHHMTFPATLFPACLDSKASQKHITDRAGVVRTQCTGYAYYDRFFSSPLPAGASYTSPTTIIFFAEAGSTLKNKESHNPNALAPKIIFRDGIRLFCAKIEFPPKVLSFTVYFLWAHNCLHNYASTVWQWIC